MQYVYTHVYLFVYLSIDISGFMVQSVIIYAVNLFTMPGMQHSVYAIEYKIIESSGSHCLQLITVTTIILLTCLERFAINVAIE